MDDCVCLRVCVHFVFAVHMDKTMRATQEQGSRKCRARGSCASVASVGCFPPSAHIFVVRDLRCSLHGTAPCLVARHAHVLNKARPTARVLYAAHSHGIGRHALCALQEAAFSRSFQFACLTGLPTLKEMQDELSMEHMTREPAWTSAPCSRHNSLGPLDLAPDPEPEALPTYLGSITSAICGASPSSLRVRSGSLSTVRGKVVATVC